MKAQTKDDSSILLMNLECKSENQPIWYCVSVIDHHVMTLQSFQEISWIGIKDWKMEKSLSARDPTPQPSAFVPGLC